MFSTNCYLIPWPGPHLIYEMAILDIWSPIDMQSSPRSNNNSYSGCGEMKSWKILVIISKICYVYTWAYGGVVDNDIFGGLNVNPISVGTISWSFYHKILNLDSITTLYCEMWLRAVYEVNISKIAILAWQNLQSLHFITIIYISDKYFSIVVVLCMGYIK